MTTLQRQLNFFDFERDKAREEQGMRSYRHPHFVRHALDMTRIVRKTNKGGRRVLSLPPPDDKKRKRTVTPIPSPEHEDGVPHRRSDRLMQKKKRAITLPSTPHEITPWPVPVPPPAPEKTDNMLLFGHTEPGLDLGDIEEILEWSDYSLCPLMM